MTAAPVPVTPAETARRQEAAATLRAVADLIEARPDLPEPDTRINFYVFSEHGDVPAILTAITTALPGPWNAKIQTSASTGNQWLYLTASPGSTDRTEVRVSARAKDACTMTGTRTVTTWQPLPAVAALITDPAALED